MNEDSLPDNCVLIERELAIMEPQIKAPRVMPLEGVSTSTVAPVDADERRFVNLNIQHFSEVYQENSLIKSPQSQP